MANIVFTNKETAAKYEALTEFDQFLEIPPRPGGTCTCQAYRGPLSGITPCAAERYLEYKGNLIRQKNTPLEVVTETITETIGEEKSNNKKNS